MTFVKYPAIAQELGFMLRESPSSMTNFGMLTCFGVIKLLQQVNDAEKYRLCNHSPVIGVEIDSLAWLRSQLGLALINAGIACQEYIDSVRGN